jgi:DNA polymerase-4
MSQPPQRKIIHVDMDCFYAAIEIRDNPALQNKPVAVGGSSDRRGVLCTCNYIAREYGVRSAMPTGLAYKLCADLIVVPVNMQKYKEAAKVIHHIFSQYTDLVEPLSLDEAFLDVSLSTQFDGSATLIAKDIQQKIKSTLDLTASAGVAPNKFLAKIASGWKKPNGLFVIRPNEIEGFITQLPVKELHGVGKVTAQKLYELNFNTCADLQTASLNDLIFHFGKLGHQLYNQSRGIDNRKVEANRVRKSLSVEETFSKNIENVMDCETLLTDLFARLQTRLANIDLPIRTQFLKIKYSTFKQTTIERSCDTPTLKNYLQLFNQAQHHSPFAIRLLGIGVRFETKKVADTAHYQQRLF